jgi:hypothetical protein
MSPKNLPLNLQENKCLNWKAQKKGRREIPTDPSKKMIAYKLRFFNSLTAKSAARAVIAI